MNNALFSSAKDDWETPQDFFDKLNDEFHFTLDPCSTDENAKCEKHFTVKENGLVQDWIGERVFCNPPYGRKTLPKWIKKCFEESQKGSLVVMLIPARTDTKAFHKYIYKNAEIRFIYGRLKFSGAKNAAPFPSMVVIFNKEREENA